MKHLSIRNSVLVAAAAGVIAVGAIVAACGGSSNNSGNNGSSSGGTSSGSSGSVGAGSCTNPTVGISFSPMYSAFIPGSTQQQFQIPAITDDGNSAQWTTTDTTNSVSMSADPTTGGVMITVTGTGSSGTVTIIATESGGACGVSTLNITTNSENDWQTGSARYNDGIALHVGAPAGFDGGGGGGGGGGFEGGVPEGGIPEGGGFHHHDGGGFFQSDGGSFFEEEGGTACTNCHGSNSTSQEFIDVSHTPEQTGGFSDEDLINIIVNGEVPDGGYFDPTVIITSCDGGPACTAQAYQIWHQFHRWADITSDEYAGIVCYLRSLTPEPQTGKSGINFGGHGGGHGGSSSGGTTSSSGGTTSGSSSGTVGGDE